MLHRRSLARPTARRIALATGVLLVAAPLSSCGFDNATDQIYVSSAGVDSRLGPVDILSAVVVSAEDGSGTFIATFSNNDAAHADHVTGLTAGTTDPTLKVFGFETIKLTPGGFVNLADVDGENDGVVLTSDRIKAGYYVDLVFDFGRANQVKLSVPVVADDNIYEGLDRSGSVDLTPTESPSPAATKSPKKS